MPNVGYVYLGEAAGARIIRADVGFSQVGDPYNLDAETWSDRPLGDAGEVDFRWVMALVKHTQGYNLQIQPFVDGDPVGLPTAFSAGPPPGTRMEAIDRLFVWVQKRGNRVDVQLTTLQVLGYTELVDIVYGYLPIKEGP